MIFNRSLVDKQMTTQSTITSADLEGLTDLSTLYQIDPRTDRVERWGMRIIDLIWVLNIVGNLCFMVSGAILLSEEFTSIPECAVKMKGWSIALTIFCGCFALEELGDHSKRDEDGSLMSRVGKIGRRIAAEWLSAIVLASAGIYVLKGACHQDGVEKLTIWTKCLVGYEFVMAWLIMMVISCSYHSFNST